jgi:hypothetical protein
VSGDAAGPTIPGGLPIHTRSLVVEAFTTRGTGVRFAGALLDQRKVGFVPTGGDLQTAGLIHHMQLEVELDPTSGRITGLSSAQPTVAFEASPASGGDCCRDPAPRLLALVGERIDGRFPRRLASTFGGPLGCSHLLTLAQLLAASVPRFLAGARLDARSPDERIAKRSLFLDGFEREGGGLDVCVQLSEFQLRPAREVRLPLDRLLRQHEVRIHASLDDRLETLERLEGGERVRDAETLEAPWQSRRTTLSALEGAPALRGLAARVLGTLGTDPAAGPLRDALLNLAPGVIQCLAAFSQRLVAAFAGGSGGRGSVPRELSVGGYPDSCYMWRSDGPMARARARGLGDRDQ